MNDLLLLLHEFVMESNFQSETFSVTNINGIDYIQRLVFKCDYCDQYLDGDYYHVGQRDNRHKIPTYFVFSLHKGECCENWLNKRKPSQDVQMTDIVECNSSGRSE